MLLLAPMFSHRQENKLSAQITSNKLLITAWIGHYPRFVEELEESDSDIIDISFFILCEIIPYFIVVLL